MARSRKRASSDTQGDLLGADLSKPKAKRKKRYEQPPPVFCLPHVDVNRDGFTCAMCGAKQLAPGLIDKDVAGFVHAYGLFMDKHKHQEEKGG